MKRPVSVIIACVAAASLAPLAFAARAARVVTWGSSLQAAPTRTIPGTYAADAEFWPTAIAGGAARAPVSGRIMRVNLRVGDDTRAVPLRFSVVKPVRGGLEVLTTSTPDLILPAHSPGVHVFDFARLHFGYMPINKGDYLAISTPGVKPRAMIWYGAVAGSSTDSFTHHGFTQNPGYVWHGTAHAGVELLMQVVERPGRPYHFHVRR